MKLVICLVIFLVAVNASVIRRETHTELGAHIEGQLKTVLAEIEKAVDQGKTVAHDLLTKSQTLLDQAKTIGGQVWHTAQGELAKLNEGASTVFSNFLKGISSLWHELQHVVGKRSAEKRFLLDDIKAFNERLSKNMQALFHDIGSHLKDFHSYIASAFKQQVHNAQPVIDNIKGLAENFLNATAAKSQEVVKQAQTFFQPYKHDLGELWTEIECEYQHIVHSGPACAAASRREANLDTRETQTDLGAKVEAELKAVLSKIENAVDQGKTVAHDLLTKSQTLLDQAKTIGGQVWHTAQGELAKLNEGASTVFSNFLKGISSLWHELQHVVGKRSAEKRFLLDDIKAFNERLSKNMQALFHDIGSHLKDFHSYIASAFKQQVHNAQPVIDNIKGVAENFLNATAAKSQEVVKQAQTFFQPYKHDLGELWTEIECEYQHIVHSGPACAAASRREANLDTRETQTDLGAKVEAELKAVLSKIENAVDQGKTVAHDLLTKSQTLLDQAKTIGGQVWHTAQGEIAKLNEGASTVFSNFLKGISSLWHELQHVVGKRSAEKRFLLDDIKAFNERLSKNMQALFHDIGSHLKDFHSYIASAFKQQVHNAQPVIDNIKGVAENFLNATAAKSQEVVKQAQTFFQPYKHDLGELWTEIECEYQHIVHSGPACAAASRREANLDARETQTDFGAKVEAELKAVLSQIEKAVDQGKTVAHDLLTKSQTLLDQAKTIGGQVWHTAQGELAKLNEGASTVFSNFLKGISSLWHELQHVVGKRSAEKRFLLDDIKAFNERLSKNMQALFHDIGSHLKDFHSYIASAFKQQVHNAQPVIDNIKGVAENFLNATAAKSQEVVKQAQTFFQPYKHDLGELWTEIECEYQHIVHSGPACAAASRREANLDTRETQTDLGAKVEAELKAVLSQIEKAVDQGKTVAHDLLTKSQTLLGQAKTIGGQVWHTAQGEIAKLNEGASTVFSNFLKGISSLWHELQHVVGKRSAEKRFLLDDIKAFNERLSKNMQTLFHDIGSHLKDFHSYIASAFKQQVHNAQPVIDNIKGLAENFLNATAAKSQEVVKQAQTFFQPYKHDLGELWTEIECEYQHIVHSGPACAAASRREANLDTRETQTDLGTKVEAELKAVLSQIEKTVDQGKTVAHDLLTKSHTLLDQAKTIGGQVWHTAQGEIAKLNDVASGVLGEFFKGISSLWHDLQHVIGKRSAEKRFLLDDIKAFNERLSKNMQALFHDIGSHLKDFHSYIASAFKQQVHNAQPVIDNIKGLAQNFLNATAAKSQEVVKQAQTFFQPYKHDLGELWTEIECEYQHIVHSGPACAAASRREANLDTRETQTDLGAKIEAELKAVLSHIEKTVDQGKTVAHDLLTKSHTLLDQAKTIGGQVWHTAQGEIAKLNNASSSVLGGFFKGISSLWHDLQHVIGKRNAELEKRFLADSLQELSVHLGEQLKKIFTNVGAKFHDFNQYLVDLYKKGTTAAKPVVDNVKVLAHNFLTATQSKSKEVVTQAKAFFEPYKHDLGELWSQVECTFNHVVHNAAADCHEAPAY